MEFKKFEQFVNEAYSVDVEYVLKEIKEYNRGTINLDQLAERVVKHLNYPTNTSNLRATKDHFYASAEFPSNKIPVDKDVVWELEQFLD